MAVKISDLPAASVLDGSELLETVQGGISKQTTAQDVSDLAPTPGIDDVLAVGQALSANRVVNQGVNTLTFISGGIERISIISDQVNIDEGNIVSDVGSVHLGLGAGQADFGSNVTLGDIGGLGNGMRLIVSDGSKDITLNSEQITGSTINIFAGSGRFTINDEEMVIFHDDLINYTAGTHTFIGKINLPAGNSNSIAGTATLVAGTIVVATTSVTTNSKIFLSVNTPGGTTGVNYAAPSASIINGTSFVINSSSAAGAVVITDVSSINWWIVN